MGTPNKEMVAVAEHLRQHVNPTPEVVAMAQAVADFAAGQPAATTDCPSLSREGVAQELETRAAGQPGNVEWAHVGANLRKMVVGLKESPKAPAKEPDKAQPKEPAKAPPAPAPAAKAPAKKGGPAADDF